MATKKEIDNFLEKMRLNGSFYIVNTKKNRETRYRLGITEQDQEDLIYDLTELDFVSGPENDYDESRPGEIWIFKKAAYKTVFYIKIKFENNGAGARAISCHIDNIEVD